MPRDDNFLGVAGAATCAAGFVAMIILYAASLAGAEAVTVDLSRGLSKADVHLAAHAWNGSRRRGAGGAVKLGLAFDGVVLSYVVTSAVEVEGWGTVVIGETEDGNGRVFAAASATTGITHLTIHDQSRAQKIFARDGVTASVRMQNVGALPDEEEPVAGMQAVRRRSTTCDPGEYTDRATGRTVVRVGVLHTPEVLTLRYYGGSSEAVRAEVAVAVAVANAEAFPKSGIDLKIELCANDPIDASLERSSPRSTLDAFAASSAVEAVRAANKCDTMVLFATLDALGNRACGIGFLPGEYAVVAADCFVDNYSFLHELGHNLGACHGPPSRMCLGGANAYGDSSHHFRTILAYRSICGEGSSSNCTRVPRYSSSDTSLGWHGHAIGDDRSNNAATLNANKEVAARKTC